MILFSDFVRDDTQLPPAGHALLSPSNKLCRNFDYTWKMWAVVFFSTWQEAALLKKKIEEKKC